MLKSLRWHEQALKGHIAFHGESTSSALTRVDHTGQKVEVERQWQRTRLKTSKEYMESPALSSPRSLKSPTNAQLIPLHQADRKGTLGFWPAMNINLDCQLDGILSHQRDNLWVHL